MYLMDIDHESGTMETNKQSEVFINYRHSDSKQRSPEENAQELDLVAALVEDKAHEAQQAAPSGDQEKVTHKQKTQTHSNTNTHNNEVT